MCYRITTHSLRCDSRPFVSDGHRHLVNGYDDPLPCPCGPDPKIRSWMRCPDHGCCRTVTRLQPCTHHLLCGDDPPLAFHIYERARGGPCAWPRASVFHDALRRSPPDRLAPHICRRRVSALLALARAETCLALGRDFEQRSAAALVKAAAGLGPKDAPHRWRFPAAKRITRLRGDRMQVGGIMHAVVEQMEFFRWFVFGGGREAELSEYYLHGLWQTLEEWL